MSTPITDATYEAVRSFTNEEQAVDALVEMRDISRKLERENAALRSDLNKCNNLSEIRRDAFYDEKSARWAMVDRMHELERENAALRDLAARMATEMREVDHEFASLRDYEAARKEAQP